MGAGDSGSNPDSATTCPCRSPSGGCRDLNLIACLCHRTWREEKNLGDILMPLEASPPCSWSGHRVGRLFTILVTGSRDWTDQGGIAVLLDHYAAGRDIRVVHGGQRGADMLADKIARGRPGWEVQRYVAHWRKYGKAAGAIRNQEMIDKEHPDLVIAFPLPQSKGTYDCINRARKAKIKIAVCEVVKTEAR